MEVREAGASLDALISSFNARIAELQQLVIARNMSPTSSVSDLSAIDVALKGMELQVQNIKVRLHEETQVIPKAKKLSGSTETTKELGDVQAEVYKQESIFDTLKLEEPAPKGRTSPLMWYVTGDELNSVPAYMKQRLTLDKVNAAIGDMATYTETNGHLITAPRKKLMEKNMDRALVLRHLGQITETRIGHHRVMILLKP